MSLRNFRIIFTPFETSILDYTHAYLVHLPFNRCSIKSFKKIRKSRNCDSRNSLLVDYRLHIWRKLTNNCVFEFHKALQPRHHLLVLKLMRIWSLSIRVPGKFSRQNITFRFLSFHLNKSTFNIKNLLSSSNTTNSDPTYARKVFNYLFCNSAKPIVNCCYSTYNLIINIKNNGMFIRFIFTISRA